MIYLKSKKGFINIGTIISTAIIIIILIVLFKIYKQYYFNDFEKAVTTADSETKLMKDSDVKYSDEDSYRITNEEYNDTVFYKEIEVENNTPYRISCMVKTENVVSENENEAGAMIWIMGTQEYSIPVTGNSEWQRIELIFDSKNRDKVQIAFRLGGNSNRCTGTAWFTDFKLEKATKHSDSEWNVGCFILKNVEVNIDRCTNKIHYK